MALNHRPTTIIAAIMVCIFLFPFSAGASRFDTERDIQKKLEHSREIAGKAKGKQKKGDEAQEEIKALTERAKEINELQLALQEEFKAREKEASELGPKAIARHREMVDRVNKALDEYLNLIEILQTEQPSDVKDQQSMIEDLEKHLESILHKKKLPILGALPYRQLNYPATEPDQASAITPAYKGGNKTVSPADLEGTEEAPVSSEIAAFAQSLNWSPVLIYEYVKNNVETEWYRGCMKGAEETLRQKSGNDCDQAALLISLLRASGYPSRCVRGTMEFFAGGVNGIPMEKVKNLTGIEDPWKIAEFFQKAGIPYKPVIAGGKITNFQIEHLWVESQIPYANYRGTVIDEHGKTWLGLDTSIKPKGYTYNTATDIFQQPAVSAQLSAMRDEYLRQLQTLTPLEYLKTGLQQSSPGYQLTDLMRTRTLNPEVLNILPASMQFVEQKITHEYTAIPDELKHKVRFVATDSNNSELMNLELSALELSNRQITLTYEPETVEDQEIINHYGGLDNTPAYLVRLRPTLKVDGERMVIAQDGLPMGADYDFAIELISPNGTEKTTNTHIVGNLSSIGIVAEKANSSQHTAISEEDDAETILHKEAVSYIDRWNKSEEELASLLHLTWTRPIPTVTTVGGVLDVTYFLNVPVGVEWKGVYLDACARSIEATPSHSPLTQERESARRKTFMQLSALEGSALEHKVFEDDFQVESISTAKLFSIAGSTQNTADGGEILIIDKTNINSVLPTLPFDDNIKEDITNAVNQNYEVCIPNSEMTYEDWTGIGYIKENPTTGEAGYMLSGMIAGSYTVHRPEDWKNQDLVQTLKSPYSGTASKGPATKITKIASTDRQTGTVGKQLSNPLMAFVQGKDGKPVEGASVTFRVTAGKGSFNGKETFTTSTGKDGVAKAILILGQKTSDNPIYIKLNQTDEFATQVGLNLVTASVNTPTGPISIIQPFEAKGKPDIPNDIIKIIGDGNKGLANNPGGGIKARVVDMHGNPISNIKVTFKTIKTESRFPDVPLPTSYRTLQFYKPESCPIPYPLYGECPIVEQITITTDYSGASVNTMLGNTVGTKYTVEAKAVELDILPALFTLYTGGFRNKDDYIPPGLYIRTLPMINEQGQPVNATKAGTQLKTPLTSELIMLYDDYTMEGPHACAGGAGQCWTLKPAGIVKVKTISNGTVTYAVSQSSGTMAPTENLGNGKYQARYTAGIQPMANKIEALGEAELTVPVVLNDPFVTNILLPSFSGEPITNYKPLTQIMIKEYREDLLQCENGVCKLPTEKVTLKSGQQVIFYPMHPLPNEPKVVGSEYKLEYIVYGVDVQLSITPKVTLVNNDGYAQMDTTFKYTILPAEYNAIIADIELFKDNNLISTMAGDKTQGEGTALITAGSAFDINSSYTVQTVLNRGSSMEIRGEKVKVTVTNSFVKLCKRDLDICDPTVPICFESRDWEWVNPQLHHAFISIEGETFGFRSQNPSFSSRCIFEGPGDVAQDIEIDHAAEMEGYMHGSCQPVGCENPNNLRNHIMNDLRPYYCLMPNSGVPDSMNCQEWANMMINTYCSTSY